MLIFCLISVILLPIFVFRNDFGIVVRILGHCIALLASSLDLIPNIGKQNLINWKSCFITVTLPFQGNGSEQYSCVVAPLYLKQRYLESALNGRSHVPVKL